MKQSNYITKYDYLNYYTKQPQMWFFTNAEIKTALQLQLASLNAKLIDVSDDGDDEELEYEFDAYEAYREKLDDNSHIDQDDHLIMIGQRIDHDSKQFIIDYHTKKYSVDFQTLDFDVDKCSLLDNHNKTMSILQSHNFVILFQPVFYDPKHELLTKCDAVVKYYNEIYLIETKATSTAKFHHFLDLYFQKRIVETNLMQFNYDFNYQLCLIKYEYLPKHQVSFIISDTINLKKAISINPNIARDDINTKQAVKIGAQYSFQNKRGESKEIAPLFINDVLNLSSEFMEFKIISKTVDVKALVINTINEFYDVTSTLWNHKKMMDKKEQSLKQHQQTLIPDPFLPDQKDKYYFKNTDLWLELRYLYKVKGMDIFGYSGNVINFNSANLEQIKTYFLEQTIYQKEDFIKGTAETRQNFANLFFANHSKDIFINEQNYSNLISNLKANHVYFDFETINPPIRAFDNSLPFAQIVTQCSILKLRNQTLEPQCVNLMCDPLKIDVHFFEQIVDSLYEGKDYSYIVYNKTFEENRLKEFINYINKPTYTTKIKEIITNLFDLADFFKVKKDSQIIFVKKLGGFYSIKKVLPLVSEFAPDIFAQTKCIDYHDLNIYNGVVCQSKSLKRFLNLLSDQEWQIVEHDSKLYCENDVRAMVAVLLLVYQLAKQCL